MLTVFNATLELTAAEFRNSV